MTLDADRWYRPDPYSTAPYTRPRGPGAGELLAWLLVVVGLLACGWYAFVGHPVDATVTTTAGDGTCTVRWAGDGGAVHDAEVDCAAGQAVGDVVRVQALGAPFVGEALDLALTPWLLGGLAGGLLVLALVVSWRRGLAASRIAVPAQGPVGPGPDVGTWGAVQPIGTAGGAVGLGAGGPGLGGPGFGGPGLGGPGFGSPGGTLPGSTAGTADRTFAGPVQPDVPDVVPRGEDLAPVDVYVAVRVPSGRPADPAALVAALRPTGFVGAVVDGARVDAPGWLLASTTGYRDGTLLRWAVDGSLRTDLRWETVRAALVPAFGPDVQVGRHVVLDRGAFPGPAGLASLPAVDSASVRPAAQVAVGRWPRSELAVVARGVGAPLHAAPVDDVVLLEHAEPGTPPRLLYAAAYETSSPRLLLWSIGSQQGFQVFHHGEPVVAHAWGVRWHVVDPSPRGAPGRGGDARADGEPRPVDDVLDAYRGMNHGGELLASLFAVENPVRVRELDRLLADESPAAAVPRLLAALGLPAVAGEVLAGRRRVADLPGARLEVPVGLARALLRTMTTSDWRQQPARSEAARRRWYEWPDSVSLPARATGVLVAAALNAGYRFAVDDPAAAWFALGGAVLLVLVDVLIERRRRRRIARAERSGAGPGTGRR